MYLVSMRRIRMSIETIVWLVIIAAMGLLLLGIVMTPWLDKE
jgi:hypothetical protein